MNLTVSFTFVTTILPLVAIAEELSCRECGVLKEGLGVTSDNILLSIHFPSVCYCSLPNKPRIRGGVSAVAGEFPWLVAIRLQKEFDCGGSLINDRYVLTAGHCLSDRRAEDVDVVIGAHDQFDLGDNVVIKEVEKIIIHPDYKQATTHDSHDIGLILLYEPVDFSGDIAPICLPSKDQDIHSLSLYVAGWGIADDGEVSNILLKAQVTSKNVEKCLLDSNYTTEDLEEDNFCALGIPGRDSCSGDSGGPAMLKKDQEMYVVGIVSWGEGCAQEEYPGIYVSVPYYLDWILENTSDGKTCKN